jgi:hypothetical protein
MRNSSLEAQEQHGNCEVSSQGVIHQPACTLRRRHPHSQSIIICNLLSGIACTRRLKQSLFFSINVFQVPLDLRKNKFGNQRRNCIPNLFSNTLPLEYMSVRKGLQTCDLPARQSSTTTWMASAICPSRCYTVRDYGRIVPGHVITLGVDRNVVVGGISRDR